MSRKAGNSIKDLLGARTIHYDRLDPHQRALNAALAAYRKGGEQ